MEKENIKIKRRIITFLLVLIFALITIKLMPLFMDLGTAEGRRIFSYQIKQMGFYRSNRNFIIRNL